MAGQWGRARVGVGILKALPDACELWMLKNGTKDFGLGLVVLTTETYCAVVPVTDDRTLAFASCALLPAEATPLGRELVVMAGMPSHHGPASFARRIATVCTWDQARELVHAADGEPGAEPVFPILSAATGADLAAVDEFTTGYAGLAHATTSASPALDRIAWHAVNRIERELLGPTLTPIGRLRTVGALCVFVAASAASSVRGFVAGRGS